MKTCDVSDNVISSSARWSTLRRAFVSAVAASKGRTGETTASTGQDSRHETSFEGFKLFPRQVVRYAAKSSLPRPQPPFNLLSHSSFTSWQSIG